MLPVMSNKTLDAALQLPIPERIELVEAIWDSIVAESAAVPVAQEQEAELDRRLADMEARPSAEKPWPNVLASLKRRR